MADDISIFVKVVGQKDIVSTTNSLNKLESGVKRLSGDLSKGRISSSQYATGLKELRRGVDKSFGSWQKAKSAVDQYSRELKRASAAQAQAKAAIKAESLALKEYRQARRDATAANQRFDAEQRKSTRVAKEQANANRRLRMEFKEGYAARVQLRAAQMRLSSAMRKGIIDADQYEAQLQQLTVAQKNLGNAAHAGGRRISGTGMAIQQTGYQVGDFLVQVQGGTNFMVAFGQQATQLVGVLPMVADSLGMTMKTAIGLSAALGIAIPLITAVGAYFMRTASSAKDFESATFDINEAAKNATEELRKYREELAMLTSEYKTLGEVGIDQQIKSLTGELSALETRRNQIAQSAQTGFGASGGMFSQAELQGMVNKALADGTAEINSQILAKRQQLQQLVLQRESVEAVNRYLGDQNELVKAGASASLERGRVNRQAIIDLQEELKLQQEIVRYGEGSVEVARLRAQQEAISKNLTEENQRAYIALSVEIYNSKKAAEDMQANQEAIKSGAEVLSTVWANLKKIVSDAADEADNTSKNFGRVTWEIKGAVNEAIKLRDVMNQVSTANLGMADRASVLRAQIAAARSGQSTVGAGVQAETAISLGRAGASADEIARVAVEAANAAIIVEDLEKTLSTLLNPEKSTGGGAGGQAAPTDAVAEAVAKLQEQLNLQRELLGMTEEEAYVRQALGDTYTNTSESAILYLQQQYSETKKLIDLENERKALIESVATSFTDGLTSIVDGTKSVKEAFRDMARAVIKQLWDVYVVQQIVGGITGMMSGGGSAGMTSAPAVNPMAGMSGSQMLPQANGGAWMKGVQMFANGGVVNSPTMFGHSGGMGVMGEAGPEAIMPLKRGANGKLGVQMEGGSGAVNIVQNFSFSANGDESVKRIIAEAAPQIANMTQQKMVDQRRRGGAMKSTFG